jgi:hypothetical protein
MYVQIISVTQVKRTQSNKFNIHDKGASRHFDTGCGGFVYPCFLPAVAERLKGRSCLGSCDFSFIHYFLGLIIELVIVRGPSTSNDGWVGA